MRLQIKGKPYNIANTIVGRITFNHQVVDSNSMFVFENNLTSFPNLKKALAVISTGSIPLTEMKVPQIYAIPDIDHLDDGDLVSLDSSGTVRTLYRINSIHNSILVTERCNSKCLMCSQPPKKRDDIEYLFNIHSQLIPLIPKDCFELSITGGEPTLLEDKLFEMFHLTNEHLPNTKVHVLTNGRKFAWFDFARQLGEINTDKIVFGIPVYSDYYALHDYIVQAESAFYQTIRGLHNLARLQQRIEIRIVLHKLTIERLVKLAKYIYKNLPFVEHVAFMGLENTGFTPYNTDLLWIAPYDYMNELREAVLYLDSFGMNVSIYNLQLCILPKEIRRFARKSISEWKNLYLKQCNSCEVKSQCAGFFESCMDKHSRYIKPITTNAEVPF